MAQRGVNRAFILGNVGSDPEIRYTASGTAVTNFSVATSETWKDSSGEQQERTQWHRIAAFGKRAELCTKCLSKGSKVFIEGKLQTRSWEQDGQKRYSTEIVVGDVQFLSPSKSEEEGGAQDTGATWPDDGPPDDDLPF